MAITAGILAVGAYECCPDLSATSPGQTISNCRPHGPGCCSSDPGRTGENRSQRAPEKRGEYLKCPSPNIVREFAETGSVGLEAAFHATGAEQMTDAVWAYAERKAGIRQDDPASWPDGPLGLSWKGLKHNRAFDVLVDNDAERTALDAIFGPGQWLQPNPGAQALLTLPTPGAWVLPSTWHMDCGPERPSWPVQGVKLFVPSGEVGPKGGGTIVLPGAHRVVDEYRCASFGARGLAWPNWHWLLSQHPFLAQLLNGPQIPDRGRSLVGQGGDVSAVPRQMHGKGDLPDRGLADPGVARLCPSSEVGRPRRSRRRRGGAD